MRTELNGTFKGIFSKTSLSHKLLPLLFFLLVLSSFLKVKLVHAAPIWPAEETMEVTASSGSTEEIAATDLNYVQDLADILTEEEEENLQIQCEKTGKNHAIDIFILTTDTVPIDRKTYIEDFYDSHDDVLTDATIILVNMDPDNRGVEIQGYGQCEFSISDNRIELILDAIVPFLSEGDYNSAFETYISEVSFYMATDPDSSYVHTEKDNESYNENYYEDRQKEKKKAFGRRTLLNLFLAALIGGGSVAVMAAHSKGRITVNKDTYMDEKSSRLLGHWDRYLRTTTTRVHKPKDNGGSHGGGHSGGGGVSSGGHSHSGGGRSF